MITQHNFCKIIMSFYAEQTTKQILPVSHSSRISIRIVVTKRKHESGFGNIRTTLVRCLTFWFTRSKMLLVRLLRQCASGKSKAINPSGIDNSIHSDSIDAYFAYLSTIYFGYSSACCLSGALKITLMSAATAFCMCLRGIY